MRPWVGAEKALSFSRSFRGKRRGLDTAPSFFLIKASGIGVPSYFQTCLSGSRAFQTPRRGSESCRPTETQTQQRFTKTRVSQFLFGISVRLAAFVLFLRGVVRPNDTLIIQEPESPCLPGHNLRWRSPWRVWLTPACASS